MISPITGQQVPVEQMAEHMRIALLDPKWKEKSGLVKAGEKEDTLALGDDVGRSLAKMAAKRKDIFGTDEEVFGDNSKAASAPAATKVFPHTCKYTYTYIHTHTHTNTSTNTFKHTHTCTRAHTNTHAHTHTHTYIYTYV